MIANAAAKFVVFGAFGLLVLGAWRGVSSAPDAGFHFPLVAYSAPKGIALHSGTLVFLCPDTLGASYDGSVLTMPAGCTSDRVFSSGFN